MKHQATPSMWGDSRPRCAHCDRRLIQITQLVLAGPLGQQAGEKRVYWRHYSPIVRGKRRVMT